MLDVDKQSEWEDIITGVALTTSQTNTSYLNHNKWSKNDETLRNIKPIQQHCRTAKQS